MNIEKAVELLQKIEWCAKGEYCYFCSAHRDFGHQDWCEFGQALAELQKKPLPKAKLKQIEGRHIWMCQNCEQVHEIPQPEPTELTRKRRMRINTDVNLLKCGLDAVATLRVIATEALKKEAEAYDIIDCLAAEKESEVKHPINSEGKINHSRNCCYQCGQTVKNQKYCHNCGRKLLWPKSRN